MIGFVRWTGRVLGWCLILGICAAISLAVLIPRIGGATPYVILTGSMSPEMPPGTLVVVRPTDPGDIKVGSVITYQLKSGRPEVVTHRVITVGAGMRGEPVYQTRGDANRIPDEKPVRAVQVRGVRWYAVPYLGYLTTKITPGVRTVATIATVGALGLYALVMFAGAVRPRRRPEREYQHA
ncbi:MAG TPA: signal peptidase I [Aeromicrobium sp.]|nr:signal peptidase I [Aeromicrobium sp.]